MTTAPLRGSTVRRNHSDAGRQSAASERGRRNPPTAVRRPAEYRGRRIFGSDCAGVKSLRAWTPALTEPLAGVWRKRQAPA